MKLRRRDCLRAGALAGAGAMLSGCSSVVRRYTARPLPDSIALPTGAVEPIVRLLNRAAFGPLPGEVERVAALGIEKWVDEQLAGGEEPVNLRIRLHGNPALEQTPNELRDLHRTETVGYLEQAAILRAVYNPHQLYERMVDFWSNHFNIYSDKGDEPFLVPIDQVKVIRQHALGKFPDLLRASAHSPAMLAYLDNQVNKRGTPNENYARELMELHTLGVHGGYTQKDVQELARCLTGWTIEKRFLRPKDTFRFDEELHDFGAKTVLGQKFGPSAKGATVYMASIDRDIPAGQEEGERALEMLAVHPATARFISTKLCRYFLGEADPAWVERLAGIYLRTGGDTRELLKPLLTSPDLQAAPPIMKRPFDFAVSSIRALNADTDGGPELRRHLAHMGQGLYQWPMPDGYPDRTSAWTGSLLARWNFAFALTSGKVPGTSVNVPELVKVAHPVSEEDHAAALVALTLARKKEDVLSAPIQRRIADHLRKAPGPDRQPALAEAAALLIASPEFQWR